MPSSGAGPSRRSHTKSRKGCKTCKRRHIRCDESFPQCNNCTKHQVCCDYMEAVGSDTESHASPELQQSLAFTPRTESRIDLWQQTGDFPYPELQVRPVPQTADWSKDELRLMHHLSTVSHDLSLQGTSNLTIWTPNVPKFLGIAASYPYVMHALLSFSANHLAWSRSSTETRNLQIQHGTIALRGLHDAIGNFSQENADAVLAASLLLLWQATDWKSWSSLRSGVQSVLAAMQSWKHESLFADLVNDEEFFADLSTMPTSITVDTTERTAILQSTMQSLQRLQLSLIGDETEAYWIGQLIAYLQRLHASVPAQTADEQFSHLYLLRKWIFWVPIQLLQGKGGQGPALLTLAHFYATALAIEPLFPDLGSNFCAKVAWAPLEAIITVTNAMQSEHAMDQASTEIASLMQFPQRMALSFQAKIVHVQQAKLAAESPYLDLDPNAFEYTSIGTVSPAFATPALHYSPPPTHSNRSSTYLDVPLGNADYVYGLQHWRAVPSPGFPPAEYAAHDDFQAYDYGDGNALGVLHGGILRSPGPDAGSRSEHRP